MRMSRLRLNAAVTPWASSYAGSSRALSCVPSMPTSNCAAGPEKLRCAMQKTHRLLRREIADGRAWEKPMRGC